MKKSLKAAAIATAASILILGMVPQAASASGSCARTNSKTSTSTTVYNNACYQVKAHIRRVNSGTGVISTYSSGWQFNTAYVSNSSYYPYDNRGQVSDGAYTYPWYAI